MPESRSGCRCGGGGWDARQGAAGDRRRAAVLAGRIAYDPPMPALRDQLTQRMPAGSVIKFNIEYETPFWRADGFPVRRRGMSARSSSRSTTRRRTRARVCSCASSKAPMRADSVCDPREERKKTVMESLIAFYGDRAADAVDFVELRLVLGGMDPRALRRAPGAGSVDPVRTGAAGAGRSYPLGGHRDRTGMGGIHGRRAHQWRARRRRGTHRGLDATGGRATHEHGRRTLGLRRSSQRWCTRAWMRQRTPSPVGCATGEV